MRSDRERFLAEIRTAEDVVGAPDRALELVELALGRWRGEPWAGLERPAGVEADRAHLLWIRTAAIRIRATALIALHRRNASLDDLRELLRIDPYDEFARYHLVHMLTDTEQRAEALRTIHEPHRLFAERGLLLDRALGDVKQRLPSEEFAAGAEAEPLPQTAGDFVGRHREIEAIAGLQIPLAGRSTDVETLRGSVHLDAITDRVLGDLQQRTQVSRASSSSTTI